jgi:hypothetical protein
VEAAEERFARRYQSRPGRPALVAPSLDELHGPTAGTVELPNRLLWRPNRRVDLDDAWSLGWMYALVLREASLLDDLRAWIDGNTLIRLWADLNLPRGVRQAWEERHPELRRMHAAA